MDRQQERRADSAQLTVAGCGWLLIVVVVALPGFLAKDVPLTVFMAALGAVAGGLWARRKLQG